jgi:hypothetical protein
MSRNQGKAQPTLDQQVRDLNSSDLESIPYFGIWHLTVTKATELVALDKLLAMPLQNVAKPTNLDESTFDLPFMAVLKEEAKKLESQLVTAIDQGNLKAAQVLRDPDERIIPDRSYIDFNDLTEWLRERGYMRGDALHAWLSAATNIFSLVCEEVSVLKAASRRTLEEIQRTAFDAKFKTSMPLDRTTLANATAPLAQVIGENEGLLDRIKQLSSMAAEKQDRPLNSIERNTLLTIIAAFCKWEGIDPKVRGSTTKIVQMTEDLGAPVSDDTIRRVLEKLSEAQESRMR